MPAPMTENLTKVGFANLATVDLIRETLEDEGYTVTTTELSRGYFEIAIEDGDDSYARGIVRGIGRAIEATERE